MDKPEPKLNELITEVARANDELIYLKSKFLRHLTEESERQKKINSLEQENQELKSQVEKYKMQNARESW